MDWPVIMIVSLGGFENQVAALVFPPRLWSRDEVRARPSAVPRSPGVYAWYFRELPWPMDTSDCVTADGHTLLYIGISPKRPPANGRLPSGQTLASRVRYHYSGNAEGSTLRLTLGCLLSERLGIELRCVGGGTRMTFATGEQTLSAWMGQNAFVCWTVHDLPWEVEEHLIRTVGLPLNLDQNRHHGFHATLTGLRREAKARARSLPVLPR
jgi:hypothetical protein